jgi:hypothetical protein
MQSIWYTAGGGSGELVLMLRPQYDPNLYDTFAKLFSLCPAIP